MSRAAILSLLWAHNQRAIFDFVRLNPGTVVLVPAYLVTPDLGRQVAEAGGELVVLESLLSDDRRAELRDRSVERRNLVQAALAAPDWRFACGDLGLPAESLAQCLDSEVTTRLADLATTSAALAEVARHFALRLVVLNEDLLPAARVIVAWARRAGVPSVLLSHSIYLNEAYTLHDQVHADLVAVFGERGLEAYKDIGFEIRRTRLTGNPAWDDYPRLCAQRDALRERLSVAYGLDRSRALVVFGTTWSANLSALGDEALYGRTLRDFLAACGHLRDEGIEVQAVVKDRPQNAHFGRERVRQLVNEIGLGELGVVYSTEEAREWVVAADVLVSVDSNLSVEAMLAGVPAINLGSRMGLHLGPSFSAESGVVEADGEASLAAALRAVLADDALRAAQVAAMQRAAPYYNLGVDGAATQRFVALMNEIALPDGEPRYPWQTLLDVEATDATQYHNWARTQLFELFAHAPRRVLDIGCGAGATGQALKQAHPGAEVFGIEVNRAAADVARTRIDHVACGKFEDIDLEAFGIAPGTLDTVFVADVLEHIYDPWQVMVRLKPYLTPDGQVIASIPNTRNLVVMDELSKGNWRYEPWGLLDVTHIRFFTLREIHRFFHETGYRITQLRHNLDGRLIETFNRYKNQQLFDLEFERMTLKKVTADELGELCTIQFYVRAEPGAEAEAAFSERVVVERAPDYAFWQRGRGLESAHGALWEQRIASWPVRPHVHLALLARADQVERLGPTLESLSGQLYEGSLISVVTPLAAAAGWQDSERLRWVQAGDDLLAAANRALGEEGAEWVGCIDAGDRLEPHALLFLIEAAQRHADWRLVYSDEDMIGAAGERKNPSFKPDFNPDLLRARPYVGGLMLVDRRLFVELGGYDTGSSGVEEHDLVLRASECLPATAIGHLPEVLLHRLEGGGSAACSPAELHARATRSLAAHLARQGIAAELADGLLPLSWQIAYRHAVRASVGIVVVVRDRADEIRQTVEAIFANSGDWPFELLLLDAGSREPETRELLDGLEAMADPRLKLYRLEQPAGRAAYDNLLAGECAAEYLLFLGSGCRPLAGDWLPALMAQAQRPELGVVGPRLLGADGVVRQSGIVLGVGGVGESAFAGLAFDQPGYAGRAHLEQNVSAVGGEALLTRAALFRELGGFDETLAPREAALDYCQRVIGSGLRILWTPQVNLLDGGSVALDEPSADESAMRFQERWWPHLARDPAYNANLSLESGHAFVLEARNVLNWDPLPWKPLPRIIAHFADNVGCGQYRILGPMGALVSAGRVQGWSEINLFKPLEVERLGLDAVVFQRQTTDEQIALLEQHRRHNRALKVFELDDLLIRLPGRSVHRHEMPKDIEARLRRAVALCDRFVVSTEPLKQAYRGYNDDIRVVPNTLERWRWGELRPLRRQSAKPRVGWVGGISHSGDLEMIVDVVRELADEVDWVFMGMCPESLRRYVREYHDGLPFGYYPAKVASLNLDLAIAPLEINPFNEAKSNLRLLEYGILGYPVICSDIYPYQGDLPVTRIRNRANDWVKAIREHVADLDECARRGDALRRAVEANWMLEDNLDRWLAAWLP